MSQSSHMYKRLFFPAVVGLILTGCGLRSVNRALGENRPTAPFASPTSFVAVIPTEPSTATPAPTATVTPTTIPDLGLIGLPAEAAGTTAFDFAADICGADWVNGNQQLACNGNGSGASTGYVAVLTGDVQGLPSNLNLLLMYPPLTGSDTITGQYPDFAVQKGDRFRAVLMCRAHTFCDVEFGLEYFDVNGRHGLAHWAYLFTDQPIVVDFSLDRISGRTVEFRLQVHRHGYGLQAYAVWIMPHIYRPDH